MSLIEIGNRLSTLVLRTKHLVCDQITIEQYYISQPKSRKNYDWIDLLLIIVKELSEEELSR